ncbi:MAG: type II toxin-antitoxin system HicA family toxin [Methanomicrobia archaeon]|nr:type II toxin-antitoxin system HicA family toxin [Methanomicrobia archaeon]
MLKKLPSSVSGEEAVKARVKLGFTPRLGKGDHLVLQNDQRVFSVPLPKTLKTGTLREIIRQAGLSVEEFKKAL